ncbi:MAG: site-specific integrase [Ruminococcaceae bacterium]|nr:site-specific integrase [Oscillospiraceae bacterium]
MAKRRASGEGNIRKRSDGRWEGRYVAGHDANGKPIRKNVLGKTQAEVRDKLKQAIADSNLLDIQKADEYTVGKWVEIWYEVYSKPNIREKTQKYYETFINRHVIPMIGDIKLKKLTGRDLQIMYNEVREHGRIRVSQKDKNPGMSASYVNGLHRMMHNCLNRAVKERLILRNPADDCIAPKLQRTEMKVLKAEDVGAYLKAAEELGILPMFFLELCTGLRKGELTALLWEDLDVENKVLTVNKQAVSIDGGGVKVLPPKTETSIRKIAISQETLDHLIAEHAKHPDNPYMFPSPRTGEMYHPDSIVNLHRKILKRAGLEPIRMHDLRHTFATLALQNGVDIKTVSWMLGHHDAGFTLRTYTHATVAMQAKAAETMGSLMAKSM